LRFDIKHVYKGICNGQEIMFDHYTKWGLPSYLGYKKSIYRSTKTPAQFKPDGIISEGGNFGFDYEYPTAWLDGDSNWVVDVNNPYPSIYYLEEDSVKELVCENSQLMDTSGVLRDWQKKNEICNIDIMGDDVIYMELEKYNSIDEITPYSQATNNTYKNDYNGIVNSAFAKIPITATPDSQLIPSRTGLLENVSQYNPPIDKIRKLKFTFRYHDGRLVEFKDAPFNFTIAFGQLKDEIARDYTIRIPTENYI